MGKSDKKKKKKNGYVDIDPRVEYSMEQIEAFMDDILTYLIPVYQSKKELKKKIKKIRKKFDEYRRGETDILSEDYERYLENTSDD